MILVVGRGHFCPKDQQKIYNGYWFWGSTDELWWELRAISARIRPDWDLGASGLRESWEAGERAKFYPYGER
jgi:hypothetical protein